ncbi:MAG TPA: carbohydrate ABC transporter permease [Candidatus Dormibacteraeota bacterium]
MSRAVGRALVLAPLLVFALAPLQWMVVASLKPGDAQLITGNPWWAAAPDWRNYRGLLDAGGPFPHWLANTLLVLGATLAISLVSSVLAAFALAYLRVPARRSLPVALFATYLLPQGVLFLPLVGMLSRAHLLNSPLALVLTYPGLVIPFGTWVLWSFFSHLPRDLVDLALVEGASTRALLVRVLLPMALPAVAAIALFGVAIVFNDYLYAFAFISDERSQTIVGAVGSTSTDISDAGGLFAAALAGIAPVAVACAFFADAYARGMGAGVIE